MSKRPYESELRQRQAEQTRDAILRAARRCFLADGFSATTIKRIARAAGVSAATVYASFGSKAALVASLIDQIEADADVAGTHEPAPTSSDDPLSAWVRAHGRVFAAAGDVLRIADQAAGDPDVAAMVARGDAHRREAITTVVRALDTDRRLQPDLTVTRAIDQVWAVSAHGPYLRLVNQCRWTHDEYVTWLEQAVRALVLRPHRSE